LPLQCAVVSLYSVVKQRLKCNTGKVCNCLIQFLLTVVLSIEERVSIVEYVFGEGNRYTDLVQQFAKNSQKHPVPYRNAVRRFTEKFRKTGSVLDAERSGRPSELNEKKLMDIYDCMLRSPSKSLRKLAQEKDIGLTTAYKAVRTRFCRKCLGIKLTLILLTWKIW
jgi:transposase